MPAELRPDTKSRPRQKVERLTGFRAGGDRQNRREKPQRMNRPVRLPENTPALAVDQILKVALGGVSDQIADNKTTFYSVTRPSRYRVTW